MELAIVGAALDARLHGYDIETGREVWHGAAAGQRQGDANELPALVGRSVRCGCRRRRRRLGRRRLRRRVSFEAVSHARVHQVINAITAADIVRLLIATLGGAAVGVERQWPGHA